MKESPPEPTRRILNVLLLICSVSLPVSIFLTAYFLLQRQEIANLKASLLSRSELQAEVLSAQPLKQTLMPHLVDDISFVLNPYAKRSAIAAPEGETYPINSLGLRGEEIERKQAGVTRILLVGDSVVFGWKLKEEDKLSSILNQYTAERIHGEKRVEFLTVALLGWNVRSERAFLESHLFLLEPDLVVWWSIGNDIADTPGVIPPGTLANWASPQAKDQSSFAPLSALNRRGGSFMPAIAERREENIDLIASFQSKYDVPIVLLGLPAIDEYQRTHPFHPPQIFIPPEYSDDERWALSATDGHPSAWANHVLAVGVLRKLIQLGTIPELEFAVADTAVALAFEETEARRLEAPEPQPEDFSSQLAQIPTEYGSEDGRDSKSVLYGVGPGAEMAKAGTLFLRDPKGSAYVTLSIAPPPNIGKYPGTARFTVRNRNREETHTTVRIDSVRTEVRLPVPETQEGLPVYEISWTFDYLFCEGPGDCSVGKLLQARFEP